MDNHIKIIGCLQRGLFCAQISYNGKAFTKISLEGEEKIPWSKDIFFRIRDNEQIDTNNAICQIVLFSDTKLEDVNVFFDLAKTATWKWSEIISAIEAMGIKPASWKLEGVALKEKINNSLPHLKKGKLGEGFIYASPKIEPPEDCVPWKNTENVKPVEALENKPIEKHRIAKKTTEKPAPEKSSKIFDALRDMANTPKN